MQLECKIDGQIYTDCSTYCDSPVSNAPLLGPKSLSAKEDPVQVMVNALIGVTTKTLFKLVVGKWRPHIERQQENICETSQEADRYT